MPLDASSLLTPVTDDEPTGPNLEFDPDFGALDRSAQGKPEQQYGDTVIGAEEPDWKDVAAQAEALIERSRDLRVLAHLAVARLHVAGLPAFAEVLALTRDLLDERWDGIHPQLDPEDDNDPTLRANALLRLGQPATVLKTLRTMPLAGSPRMGQVSWRDVALATGAIEADPEAEVEKPSESTIRGAFRETDPARLSALREAATRAGEAAAAIPKIFDERSGSGTGPDLTELVKLLKDLVRTIDRYADFETGAAAGAEGEAELPAEEAGEPAGTESAGPVPTRRGGGVSIAALTEVTNRSDALRLLDLVCRYYQRYEPSSPLPMLIERARKLAEKDFLDILRELAPDGLPQAENIIGRRDE